ncbi:hypothetical protein [Streptomyces sp. NPDC057702]|uniref:hypothetical protein n=1 Tax=unclassified Streptomyces TaxID=2593676 RepID=UPI0036B92071
MGGQNRGSETLIDAWGNGGVGVTEEFVRRLSEVPGLKPSSVLVKGQPRPDLFQAVFQADGDPERCGNALRTILDLIQGAGAVGLPRIGVFPRGLTAIDHHVVEVSVGRVL